MNKGARQNRRAFGPIFCFEFDIKRGWRAKWVLGADRMRVVAASQEGSRVLLHQRIYADFKVQ